MTTENRIDCPALHNRSKNYPFGDRVPRTVRMFTTVTADPMPGVASALLQGDAPICREGEIFSVWTNSHGAVAAVLPNGKHLGLRPNEFEVETWHTEPKSYPDRLCHIDYTAHPHRCGCLSGDDEAQRRFDEYQRDTKLATAEGEVTRLTAERDALQQRLNVADQRIDDFAGGECEWSREDDSGIWNTGCGETWSFSEDGPEENGMHFCHFCGKHLVVEVAEQGQDEDWHMNPCKQGHRDVGAAGGVAACNQCDDKIEAATTQEAFERWNETHPAIE